MHSLTCNLHYITYRRTIPEHMGYLKANSTPPVLFTRPLFHLSPNISPCITPVSPPIPPHIHSHQYPHQYRSTHPLPPESHTGDSLESTEMSGARAGKVWAVTVLFRLRPRYRKRYRQFVRNQDYKSWFRGHLSRKTIKGLRRI